ncbi:hypothetical protein QTP88_018822 [Uroleucon formosanum]
MQPVDWCISQLRPPGPIDVDQSIKVVLYADGTFKSCSKLFKQFYVVHGSISRDGNEMVFPLVFALMTGKDEDLYNMLFSNLNKFAEENGIFFKENNNLEIITDFEQAAINAINNIKALGLATKYKNVLEFNFRARKTASLAFLPPEKMKEAWVILKSEFEDDEIDLATYFEENYMIGKIRMRFRKKEATRYEPCFLIKMWSVHSRTVNEMPRTSNSAEDSFRSTSSDAAGIENIKEYCKNKRPREGENSITSHNYATATTSHLFYCMWYLIIIIVFQNKSVALSKEELLLLKFLFFNLLLHVSVDNFFRKNESTKKCHRWTKI